MQRQDVFDFLGSSNSSVQSSEIGTHNDLVKQFCIVARLGLVSVHYGYVLGDNLSRRPPAH
jgi:hypothetical protein